MEDPRTFDVQYFPRQVAACSFPTAEKGARRRSDRSDHKMCRDEETTANGCEDTKTAFMGSAGESSHQFHGVDRSTAYGQRIALTRTIPVGDTSSTYKVGMRHRNRSTKAGGRHFVRPETYSSNVVAKTRLLSWGLHGRS